MKGAERRGQGMGDVDLRVVTINVDGAGVHHKWMMISEFLNDWQSDDCSAHQLDDAVVSAVVLGEDVTGNTFSDIVEHIGSLAGSKL